MCYITKGDLDLASLDQIRSMINLKVTDNNMYYDKYQLMNG